MQHIAMWGEDDSDLDDKVQIVTSNAASVNLEDTPPLGGQPQQPQQVPQANNNHDTAVEVVMVAERFTL